MPAAPQLRGKIGIDGERDFKAAMKEAGNAVKVLDSELQLLSSQFKAGEQSMEQYQRQHDALSQKLAAQRSQVATMESVLSAVKAKFGENSNEAAKYTVELNKAKAAVAATEGELKRCEKGMEEFQQSMTAAGKAADKLEAGLSDSEKAADDQGEAAEDAGKKNDKLREAANAAASVLKGAVVAGASAAVAALAAVGVAAGKATVNLTNMGTDYQAANNLLSAQTGATGEALKELSNIAQNVYFSNFGEDIGEVNEALATTKTNTGLVGAELQAATEAGFLLRDTFGMDFQESSRAASSLMKNFGISADEAYNIMATGAQKGANQNGDMLDVLSEYGPMYASMGMSASQMMNSLIGGSEAGIFSIDKVGDAMKEFSIRCVDGSETTSAAMSTIGLDANAMAQQFAMGGENARFAFATVVSSIMAIEDPVKRSQTAVALFGTQFEDLGPNILPVLAQMASSGELTADALGQIAAVRYDDLNNSIEGFSRKVKNELAPVAQEFSGLAKGVVDDANTALSDGFQPEDIKVIGESVAKALIDGIGTLEGLVAGAQPLFASAVSAIGTAIGSLLPTMIGTLLPAATGLLQSLVDSITSNVAPLTKLATDIVTSVAGFLVENASGLFVAATELIVGLATGIGDALPTLAPAAVGMVTEIVAGIGNNLPAVVAAGLSVISNLVTGILNSLPTLAASLPEIVSGFVTALVQNMPAIVEAGANILTNLVGGMLGMLTALPDMLNAVGVAISGALSNIDWGQWGMDMIQGLVNGLGAAATTLMSAITGVFNSIWGAIKGVFGINSPSTVAAEAGGFILEGLVAGFQSAVEGVITTVKAIFGRIWDAIKGIFGFGESEESKEAKEAGADIMSGMKDGITEGEDDLEDAVKNAAKNVLSLFKSEFGAGNGSSTKTKPIGENLLKGLQDGLKMSDSTSFDSAAKTVFENFQKAINTAFGVEGTGFAGLGEKTASKFKDVGKQVCKALADGIKSGEDNSTAIKDAVIGVANAAYEATVGEISTGITGSSDSVNAAVTAAATAANDAAAAVLTTEAGSAVGVTFVDGISAGMTARETVLMSTMRTVGQAAHDAMATAMSNGRSIGTAMGTAVRNGISSMSAGVRSAASSLGSGALSALWAAVGSGGSKFTAIGNAIAQGVANGLRGGSALISSAARDAAQAAYQAACDELEIHSPSRKGLYIGRNYVQSIATGMEESRRDLTQAAATMARATNSSTQQALQVQSAAIDYDLLGRSVARANREAGLGNLVLYVGKEKLGQTLEPTVMHAGQTRSRQTVSGRGTRLLMA